MLNQIVKNSTLLLLGQVLGRFFSFLTVPLLVRGLGPKDFGAFSMATAILSLAGILAGFGVDQLIIREIAKYPGQKKGFFFAGLRAKIIGSLIVIGLITGLNYGINLFGFDHKSQIALTLLSLCIIFNGVVTLVSSYYYGQQKMAVGSALGLILYLANFIGIYLIFKGQPTVVGFALALALSSAATALCVIPFVIRRSLSQEAPSGLPLYTVRRMIFTATPFMFMGLSLVVYYKIDIFCLSYLAGQEAVGIFSAASRFLEALMFIPAALMGALFPALSTLTASAREDIPRVLERSLRYLALAGIPAAAGIFILAPQIVELLYGGNWGETAHNLQILIWTWGLIFIYAVCPVALNALGNTRINVVIIIVGVFFKIGLNFLLIPRFGTIGACWTTLLVEAVSAILYFSYALHVAGRFKIMRNILHPIAASALMCIILTGIQKMSGVNSIPVIIVAGILTYSLYFCATRAVTFKELCEIFYRRKG